MNPHVFSCFPFTLMWLFIAIACQCLAITFHHFVKWFQTFYRNERDFVRHHATNNEHRTMESFNVSCKLHGSPKNQATSTISPVHRLQTLDLMDDIPLTYCKETNTNSPVLTTPIIEHNKIMTPRRQVNHQLHALNDDLSSSTTTNHKNKTYGGNSSVCGSMNGINTIGSNTYNCDGILGTSSNTAVHHQKQSTSKSQSHYKSLHHTYNQQEPTKDDRCGLRHRWQACPELHKAMDGVNYIADHTRKEEESTKVSHSLLCSSQSHTTKLYLVSYSILTINFVDSW